MTLQPYLMDYLEYIHAEDYPAVLDDELPDHFNDWLGRLDRSDIIVYAKHVCKDVPKNREEIALELAEEFIKDNGLNI